MPEDPYDLNRFLDAQSPVYKQVRRELRQGHKDSHWIWFVFPQIAGLGASPMSRKYAITSLKEAKAYLEHSVLGARLRECVELVNGIEGHSIHEIFGYPDDLKFRSSMTLFAHAIADNRIFMEALHKYFDGTFDPMTLEQIQGQRAI